MSSNKKNLGKVAVPPAVLLAFLGYNTNVANAEDAPTTDTEVSNLWGTGRNAAADKFSGYLSLHGLGYLGDEGVGRSSIEARGRISILDVLNNPFGFNIRFDSTLRGQDALDEILDGSVGLGVPINPGLNILGRDLVIEPLVRYSSSEDISTGPYFANDKNALLLGVNLSDSVGNWFLTGGYTIGDGDDEYVTLEGAALLKLGHPDWKLALAGATNFFRNEDDETIGELLASVGLQWDALRWGEVKGEYANWSNVPGLTFDAWVEGLGRSEHGPEYRLGLGASVRPVQHFPLIVSAQYVTDFSGQHYLGLQFQINFGGSDSAEAGRSPYLGRRTLRTDRADALGTPGVYGGEDGGDGTTN